MKLNNFTTA